MVNAMKEELKPMDDTQVWDLVELPKGSKQMGCKWVFKTKCDPEGNICKYKVRLVAKSFTKKDDLITKRFCFLFLRNTLRELFWLWWLIMT